MREETNVEILSKTFNRPEFQVSPVVTDKFKRSGAFSWLRSIRTETLCSNLQN